MPLKRFEKGFQRLGLSLNIYRISWREKVSVNFCAQENEVDIWVIAKN